MTSLQLSNVNYQQIKNATFHRTIDYHTKELVVRRGQKFEIILNFNRSVQSGDSLTLTVETGSRPSESSNTKAVMPVSSSGSTTTWSAVRGYTNSSSVSVTMNPPVNAVIGRYRMKLQTTGGGRTYSFNMESFVVLFNPWASGDEVYMSNEAERAEYVLNDVGLYWFGNWNKYDYRRWNYGQFEEDILDICLTLLDKSSFYATDGVAADVSRRNDPLHVGRVMSAMVNSNDNDRGLLIGNWSGNYSGGTSPTQWNGSVAILRQWKKDGPVKYGQCWVFAGLLCTVLRCLGIPARVIINFESAHDTDSNLTIDNYYDESGKKLTSLSGDSIWNFHAWDECWSARKDIGTTYNGWQILDATPQEQSEGIFRLGPCAQKAVKEGDVDLPYDAPFVFAEVNADIEEWVVYNNGTRKKVYTATSSVGRNTCTKAVGSFEREDITNQYKYTEGSSKEREVVNKAKLKMQPPHVAARMSVAAMSVRDAAPEEAVVKPKFSGVFKNDETQVGEDLTMKLTLKNTSTTPTKLKVNTTVIAILYNNKPVGDILTESQSVMLGPNEEKTITVNIPYPKYKPVLTPDNMISAVAVCEDEMGGKLLVNNVVTLKNPPLLIRVNQEAKLNKVSTVDVIFTNPIQDSVADCVLILEGSGLMKDQVIVKVPMLKKNQRVTIEVEINPSRVGQKSLLADFNSQKFPNVKGFETVVVPSC